MGKTVENDCGTGYGPNQRKTFAMRSSLSKTNLSNPCYEKKIRHDLRPKCCQPPRRALDNKEVVIVNDIDGPRELIVPSNKPNLYHTILDAQEFNRLKSQAKVLSFQEKMALRETEDNRQKQLLEESKTRKEKAREMQQQIQIGMKLSQIEIEAQKRAQYTLKRANQLRQEQQDEVKEANSIILETKCYAIRDAQLHEKELIRREREAEEKRLDEMMEEKRRWEIKEELKRKEEEKAKKGKYLKGLLDQMEENKLNNVMFREKILEETRFMDEAFIQMQLEDLDKNKEKINQKTLFRKQQQAINDQIRREKEARREQEQLHEMRIKEFMKKKQEREDAWEQEHKMLKMAKEKEINRLFTLQKSALDQQGEADEMIALRARDVLEKEWRVREKMEAQRRKEETQALHEIRQKQIYERQKMEAIEIARDKREFERVLNYQRNLTEKMTQEELKRRKEMEKVRCDILSQINAKEVERIEERKTSFEDSLTLKQENSKREREMAEVMIDKIQNLRNYKMPEKYVQDLERKLKLEQYIKDIERLKRGEMLTEPMKESAKGKSKPFERLAQLVKEEEEKAKKEERVICQPATCEGKTLGKPEKCPVEIRKAKRTKSSQSSKSKSSSRTTTTNKSNSETSSRLSIKPNKPFDCRPVLSSKHKQ